MRITHELGDRAVKKEVENFFERGFLLTDKAGSFLSLGSNNNISHMQGLFFLDKHWNMYKTIENIYPEKQVEEIKNEFNHVTRKYGETKETVQLTSTALIYLIENYEGFINIDLDFRTMFDYDDQNRIYKLNKEDDKIIIHYPKHEKWMVIKGIKEHEMINQWIKKNYEYDKKRGTRKEFYIYKALKIKCEKNLKLSIAFSDNKEEAIKNSESGYKNEKILSEIHKNHSKKTCKESSMALNAAMNSIENLRMNVGKGRNKIEGVFAGLPWFHQIWSRDELISLKAFMINKNYEFVKKRLFAYINSINENGRIPNRLPNSKLESADSIGWLFKRWTDFIQLLRKDKLLNKHLTKEELNQLKHKLHLSIEEQLARYMKDFIIYNNAKETWMDTSADGKDTREGACIEIQALFLSGFHLMKELCKELKLSYYGYAALERIIIKKIREKFVKNQTLLDKENDITVRPNIFIAYYTYPEILSKQEWKIVFDKTIKELWLDWGGLSSISKKNDLFQKEYTGENNLSYHRGDSWYWINNLAAICMLDLDKKKYSYQAELILKASEQEILFSGLIGHASEISSSVERKSEGCLAQAWSAAMFIELCAKIKEKKVIF